MHCSQSVKRLGSVSCSTLILFFLFFFVLLALFVILSKLLKNRKQNKLNQYDPLCFVHSIPEIGKERF